METPKKKVLFLCTGNSCRSQMAEGLTRNDFGESLEVCSAGTTPQGLDPLAVAVMGEIGINISNQKSEHLSAYEAEQFDYVITLCGDAHETCPLFFGGVKRLHMGFPDPPKTGPEEQRMTIYRRLRDDMRRQLTTYFNQVLQTGVTDEHSCRH
ncbi:MAG: arsenate reductase ArsC [Desulfuromonadales bacterium]|nr:arsenate reductase ArsC [Desulfuromonadales bacterium]MBN2792481.1 arsenate reductase ArsC [Desulfuromonadales bacterium]